LADTVEKVLCSEHAEFLKAALMDLNMRDHVNLSRIATDIQRAATADGNHSAAIAAVVTKAKLAGLWIERKENKNTNFNTQVIDRRDVPLNQLTDEELLAIAGGALPEREEMKVLLLPPAPKSKP
jgi:hypothetical protein